MLKPYRIEDVAGILGVNRQTVMRWLHKGRIPGLKIHRMWLIPRAEFDRMISTPTNMAPKRRRQIEDREIVFEKA